MLQRVDDDSTAGDSNSSSIGVDRIRAMEQELFILLSRVVVAESHDDKATWVRRLGDGVRRLEGAMGTSGSNSTSTDKDIDVAGPPVASVGIERAEDKLKGEEKPDSVSADPNTSECESKAVPRVEHGDPNDSVAGEGAREGVETIEDLALYVKLRAMTEEPADHGMDVHKGKPVPVGIKPVLSHVIDSWNDHFSPDGNPDVTLSVVKFTPTTKKNNNGRCGWRSDVAFTYLIRGLSCKSDIFAMDGIYFDLNRRDEDGYGCSWINVYIPDSTWAGFIRHFKAGTGLTPLMSDTTTDENQRLISVKAMVCEDGAAKLFEVAAVSNRISVKFIGDLRDAYNTGACNAVFKGTGIFDLSVTTVRILMEPPKASDNRKVHLALGLVSARFLGATKGVSMDSFGKCKTRMYM